jgi:succinyl-diaminopimelate desuccinylase
LGFVCEEINSGPDTFRVRNLWAHRPGTSGKTLAFAGHTDVVPTGPLDQWASDPFTPTHSDGKLFGRGSCDMKTSIAAFVVATEAFVANRPVHQGRIAFLLTSDEEGPATDGTVQIVEWFEREGRRIDFCVVGEPTSAERLGDIKRGDWINEDNVVMGTAPPLEALEGRDCFRFWLWQAARSHQLRSRAAAASIRTNAIKNR